MTVDTTADPAAERKRARIAALALITGPVSWFVGALSRPGWIAADYSTERSEGL